MNMNDATKYNINDDVTRNDVNEYTLHYVTRFNEQRSIAHLTYNDAMQRAHTMRARAMRNVYVRATFVIA
jgi:hypothetical protein